MTAAVNRLLGGSVFLSPSVLDEQEVIHPLDALDTEPASEFLRPLYMSQFPGNEACEP